MSTSAEKPSFWKDRFPIDAVAHFFAKKTVPMHRHSIWYYLGGMTLFFFIIQVVTGILLLLYYRPTAEAAFESVQFIMTKVQFGWLIRSIHSWSANLMIAAAMIHMFSVFLLKAYRKPREITWISGVLLFLLALGFGFSGYLLPWNTLAYFATKVGTEIVSVIPILGHDILIFLRGGEEVTGATLTRFFGFHAAVLPMIATVLLGLHLLLVQVQGMSTPPSQTENSAKQKPMPFFPYFLQRDLLGWLVALGVLAALAALFPWELGEKADPFAPAPPGIKPEWYFLFMFQTLKYIPAKILFIDGEVLGILGFGIAGLIWLLIPFIDRRPEDRRSSRWFTAFGWLAIAFIIIMSLIAYVIPQTF
jgi:cytochrome b6